MPQQAGGLATERRAGAGPGPGVAADAPDQKLKTVIMRLPPSLVAEIDAFGGDRYLRRSERIRGLLSAGLKSEGLNR